MHTMVRLKLEHEKGSERCACVSLSLVRGVAQTGADCCDSQARALMHKIHKAEYCRCQEKSSTQWHIKVCVRADEGRPH